MAVKRMFDISNSKARRCLHCDKEIDQKELKDNTVYKCRYCGKGQIVDRVGARVTLTDEARKEYRRRAIIPDPMQQQRDKYEERIRDLEEQLAEARKDAKEWEDAAEGLARYIEEMKAKEETENGEK